MQVQPYLFFEGRCDEAIEFYRQTLGATVESRMSYKEGPPNSCAADMREKVMHASLRIGESTVLVSDGRCSGKPVFQGFGLSLTVAKDAEAERLFAALGDGGQVVEPMAQTFFASRFGMATDRFGVLWMVYVAE